MTRTKPARIAIDTLTSSTYWWPGKVSIDNMRAEHALNCLRMLERDPIASLRGVVRGYEQAFYWAEDFVQGGSAHDVPEEVTQILREVEVRTELDARTEGEGWKLLDDAHIDDIVRPIPMLADAALEWIRQTPTYDALRHRVWQRLMAAEAEIVDIV